MPDTRYYLEAIAFLGPTQHTSAIINELKVAEANSWQRKQLCINFELSGVISEKRKTPPTREKRAES
jgi:hypothetical protein